MQPELIFKLTHALNALSLALAFSELLYLRKNPVLLLIGLFSLVLSFLWIKFLVVTLIVLLGLMFIYDGAYNGGSDYMNFLVTLALVVFSFSENESLKAACLLYVGAQAILSYFVAGATKLFRPGWRNGSSLKKIFEQSHYLVAVKPGRYQLLSWSVMISEISIILGFLHFYVGLLLIFMMAVFHLINIKLLKLNRFFFAWLSSYACVLYCFYRF